MPPVNRVLNVGIIGLGPVTQAIHLPTLAGLPEEFRVVHVVDVDGATARAVASQVGARWSTSPGPLLADDRVDVVAVCSPNSHHADHVIASLRAGKAVLCEKPLALDQSELEAVGTVCQEAGVPLIVGWMHLYDPVAAEAIRRWSTDAEPAGVIRVSAVLPPNSRFERAAAEILPRPAPAPPPGDPTLRDALLGLAVHDLPLIRRLLPASPAAIEVVHASWLPPWGYLVLARVGDVRVELHASLGQPWKPSWTLEAISPETTLRIEFPPSYLHAGSAVSRLARADGRVDERTALAEDGYDREWRRIAKAVHDGEAGGLDDLLLDAGFAVAFADAADRRLAGTGPLWRH